jgi:hypothetical protein
MPLSAWSFLFHARAVTIGLLASIAALIAATAAAPTLAGETLPHSFPEELDGAKPYAGLIAGSPAGAISSDLYRLAHSGLWC